MYSGLSLFVVLIAVGLGWEMYKKTNKKKQLEENEEGVRLSC